VPDLVGEFRQFDALDLALAAVIEQAQLDLGRIGGEEREIDPALSRSRRVGRGTPRADARDE
jgi:hypothetical protein